VDKFPNRNKGRLDKLHENTYLFISLCRGKTANLLYVSGDPVFQAGQEMRPSWTDVLSWFKTQGCYVIVGAPGNFSTDDANQAVYSAANMIMPWRVGNNSNLQNFQAQDMQDINFVMPEVLIIKRICIPALLSLILTLLNPRTKYRACMATFCGRSLRRLKMQA